jgi:hypothetical protein
MRIAVLVPPRHPCLLAMVVTAATAVAACDRDPAAPAPDDTSFYVSVAMAGLAYAPATMDGSEPHEHVCPEGGRLVVEGTATSQLEDEVSTRTWEQVAHHEACTLQVNGATVTTNGEMRSTGEARFGRPVAGHSPLLMLEASQVGMLAVTRAGVTNECAYDLVFRFDAAAGEYRITGTACGGSVDMRAPAAA